MRSIKPLALRLAERLREGIVTGNDWPNSDAELLRLQAARELERLHFQSVARPVDPAILVRAAGEVA